MRSMHERRDHYRKMEAKHLTPDEIIESMPLDELRMNARKGGVLAIRELKKRDALASLKTTLDDKPLDLGI